MDQFKLFMQYQKEVAQATLKIIDRFEQGGSRIPEKRTSNMITVQNILNDAGHPLHISDIIDRAMEKYQVQLNRDSLVSAILKKINAGQTFIRTAPNTFALRTYSTKEEP
jgi:uncharacterized protein YpuA (DUF1002 family)